LPGGGSAIGGSSWDTGQNVVPIGPVDGLARLDREQGQQRIVVAGLVGELRIDPHHVELRSIAEPFGDEHVVERRYRCRRRRNETR
jgi:hypothetical protein